MEEHQGEINQQNRHQCNTQHTSQLWKADSPCTVPLLLRLPAAKALLSQSVRSLRRELDSENLQVKGE